MAAAKKKTAARPKPDTAPAQENVLYVDPRLYDAIAADMIASRSRFGAADVGGRDKEKVEALLFHEARLLDSRRYRDWLEILAEDVIYWVPGNPDLVDPRREGSVNFDDRRRLIDRITLTETGVQYAQVPPSRTTRVITNIEAWRGKGGLIHARYNLVIWEHRRGHTQCFVGWQEHQIAAKGRQWRIRRKVINLLDSDQPQGNNTFIL